MLQLADNNFEHVDTFKDLKENIYAMYKQRISADIETAF